MTSKYLAIDNRWKNDQCDLCLRKSKVGVNWSPEVQATE